MNRIGICSGVRIPAGINVFKPTNRQKEEVVQWVNWYR